MPRLERACARRRRASSSCCPEPDRLEIANTNTRYFRGYTAPRDGAHQRRQRLARPDRHRPRARAGRDRTRRSGVAATARPQPVAAGGSRACEPVDDRVDGRDGRRRSSRAAGARDRARAARRTCSSRPSRPIPRCWSRSSATRAQDAAADTRPGRRATPRLGPVDLHPPRRRRRPPGAGRRRLRRRPARCPARYVLNLGEMLQLATHGYLRATKHRAESPPPGVERISVAYFFNPAWRRRSRRSSCRRSSRPRHRRPEPQTPTIRCSPTYGDNWLKFRIRSHPDVAAIHHSDLVGGN